jgi:hypothetical protein
MKPVFLAVILAFLFALCCCDLISREGRLEKEGNEVVAKIERFKKDKGRLPLSLSEIGIEEKEEGPIYYQKQDSSKYVIWFSAELGESVTYDSSTKKWDR